MLQTVTIMLAVFSGQMETTTETDAPSDDASTAWIGDHLLGEAADYSVFINDDDQQIELNLEEPLLRFADPITNVADGYLLVWTQNGRPEACASFWVHRLPDRLRELHEFQPLSEQPILARHDETDVWQPEAAGVEWHSVTDAAVPASIKARRLAQMRQLARRFSAAIRDRSGRRQLRLMPQPVYRYASPDEQLLDGALFLFAKGTNPELLLLLGAREESDGPAWHYTTARMTIREIEIQYGEDELETKPGLGGRSPYNDPQQPYFEFRRNLQPPELTP